MESLIAEVRVLRADVARLHAAHTPVHIRHGWMNLFLKDLSTNPHTQYKVGPPLGCDLLARPASCLPATWPPTSRDR
jgi:hypothetical protein